MNLESGKDPGKPAAFCLSLTAGAVTFLARTPLAQYHFRPLPSLFFFFLADFVFLQMQLPLALESGFQDGYTGKALQSTIGGERAELFC